MFKKNIIIKKTFSFFKGGCTDRDPVVGWVFHEVLEVVHDDPLVLLPLPLQEDALCEHPRPADEGHHLQTRLAVDLCALVVSA